MRYAGVPPHYIRSRALLAVVLVVTLVGLAILALAAAIPEDLLAAAGEFLRTIL